MQSNSILHTRNSFMDYSLSQKRNQNISSSFDAYQNHQNRIYGTNTIQKKSNHASNAEMAEMENAFNTDFSNVEIFKNSNKAVEYDAQAFTSGNEIHFAPGQYNPQSNDGKKLLGHELAHVIQQRKGTVKATSKIGNAEFNDNPTLENEADSIANMALSGKIGALNGVVSNSINSNSGVIQANRSKKQKRRQQQKQQQRQQQKKKQQEAQKERTEWLDRDDGLKTNDAFESSQAGKMVAGIGYEGFSKEEEPDLKKGANGWSTTSDGLYGEKEWGEEKELDMLEKAEKEEKEENAQLLDIKKIVITLYEDKSKVEGHAMGVDAEMGRKVEVKQNIEGFQGEAEVQMQVGKGGKWLKNFMDWGIGEQKLKGGGSVEGFVGAKASSKNKAKYSYSGEEAELAMKNELFVGTEVSGKTELLIQSEGSELAKATGNLGLSLGLGGELSGLIKWDKGKFAMAGKAKIAAGLGITMGYNIEFNATGFMHTLYSWGSWAMSPLWWAMGYK